MRRKLLILLALSVGVGCGEPSVGGESAVPVKQVKPEPRPAEKKRVATTPVVKQLEPLDFIAKALKLPVDLKPQYERVSMKRLDSASAKRLEIRLVLPQGLKKTVIRANLGHAVMTTYASAKRAGTALGALTAFAYTDRSQTQGVFTVAVADYAPHGDWSKANAEVNLRDWKFNVRYSDGYFKPQRQLLATRTPAQTTKETHISKKAKSWNDGDLIGTAPKGAQLLVLESRRIPVSGGYVERYRIRYNEDLLEGWVPGAEYLVAHGTPLPPNPEADRLAAVSQAVKLGGLVRNRCDIKELARLGRVASALKQVSKQDSEYKASKRTMSVIEKCRKKLFKIEKRAAHKRAAEAREAWAAAAAKQLWSEDVNVTIKVRGKHNTEIRIYWALMSNVTVHKAEKGGSIWTAVTSEPLTQKLRALGFRKFRFESGFSYWDIKPMFPTRDAHEARMEFHKHGLADPLALN